MEKQFLFLDLNKKNIEGKEFTIIYIYEYKSKQLFKIYKLYNDNEYSKLQNFKKLENITNLIDFVIRSDNKITLNIKL